MDRLRVKREGDHVEFVQQDEAPIPPDPAPGWQDEDAASASASDQDEVLPPQTLAGVEGNPVVWARWPGGMCLDVIMRDRDVADRVWQHIHSVPAVPGARKGIWRTGFGTPAPYMHRAFSAENERGELVLRVWWCRQLRCLPCMRGEHQACGHARLWQGPPSQGQGQRQGQRQVLWQRPILGG